MRIPISTKNSHTVLFLVSLFALFIISPNLLLANEESAKKIINEQCTACHRITGEAKSRFELKAPDLMWAGVKFKRPWLVSFLTGNEKNVYQKNYRWDLSREPVKHTVLSQEEAEAVADYIKKHLVDPRIKKDAIDLSHFTELQASFGRQLFIDHSCTGCHQIMDNGKPMGGLQSATFFDSGKRLNKDWILRFNSNPPDFVPHSGEFVADVSALGAPLCHRIYCHGRETTVLSFMNPGRVNTLKTPALNAGRLFIKNTVRSVMGPREKAMARRHQVWNPNPPFMPRWQ